MRLLVMGVMLLGFPAFADIASTQYVAERDRGTVHKAGDEVIGGNKTFERAPLIPTAELPTLEK